VPVRLQFGDHVCAPVRSRDQQIADLAAFTAGGLRDGQRVLGWVGDPAAAAERLVVVVDGCAAAIGRGQVVLRASGEAYPAGDGWDVDGMLHALAQATRRAVADGYDGLRVTGDPSSAVAAGADTTTLTDYETRVNGLFLDLPLIALCHYDPAVTGSVTWQHLTRCHPTTLGPDRDGDRRRDGAVGRLRCRRTANGLRLSGAVDLANHAALPAMLAGSKNVAGTWHLDASGLRFADGAAVAALLRAAISRGGQPTTLSGPPALIRSLDLLGAASIPTLRLVTVGR
jgi:hypothetical protein